MKKYAPALFALLFILMAAGAIAVLQAQDVPVVERIEGPHLTIETVNGATHIFTLEIADTMEKMQRGLMHRTSMPDNHGMLFQFDRPHRASFWMKNTPLSLDIIYIGEHGRIINIVQNATPNSLAPLPAAGLAKGALEINGGISAQLGIGAGDKVIHSFFE